MDVADRAYNAWRTRQRVKRCLVSLVAFDAEGFPGPAESLVKPPQKQPPPLSDRVRLAYTRYASYVRFQNNGIKEKNLLRILLPVGVKEVDLDTTWLNHMEGFGASRGVVAHGSARTVQQPPDNAIVQKAVADVLGSASSFGLRDVDRLLVKLR